MSASSNPTSDRPQFERPEVPSPKASREEVREYLVGFFLEMQTDNGNEALELAKKLNVAGAGLFQATEKDLRDLYDINGMVLYNEVQHSSYGKACCLYSPLRESF